MNIRLDFLHKRNSGSNSLCTIRCANGPKSSTVPAKPLLDPTVRLGLTRKPILHSPAPSPLLSLSLSLENISFNGRPELTLPSSFLSLPHSFNTPLSTHKTKKSPIWYTHHHFTYTKSISIYTYTYTYLFISIFGYWIADFDACTFRFAYLRKELFLGFLLLNQMAAPPVRARADYDYLIKLLLIGDSGECTFVFMLFLHKCLYVHVRFVCPNLNMYNILFQDGGTCEFMWYSCSDLIRKV